MSEFKGTPGPWEIKATALVFEIVNLKECCVVARTNGWDEKFLGEERSNAQLIAAAPELLEAAIGLVDQTKDGLGNDYDDGEFPALDRLRAAINKATGQD